MAEGLSAEAWLRNLKSALILSEMMPAADSVDKLIKEFERRGEMYEAAIALLTRIDVLLNNPINEEEADKLLDSIHQFLHN